MPTTTYTPLANITLGSSASSVTFSNIPNTYRDLIMVIDGTSTSNGNSAFYFNGDTTAGNYSGLNAYGDGSSTGSGSGSSPLWPVFYTNRSSSITHFMDYSATDKHKTLINRSGAAGNLVAMSAVRWANTAAINSISVRHGASYASGTTFALYGVIA